MNRALDTLSLLAQLVLAILTSPFRWITWKGFCWFVAEVLPVLGGLVLWLGVSIMFSLLIGALVIAAGTFVMLFFGVEPSGSTIYPYYQGLVICLVPIIALVIFAMFENDQK